ncbi:MAG: hypothetical protein J5626_03300 [Lachnospiraceae bacterium]|nr:hypothetical protein [Lachnospiraceae bacterium]
MDKKTIPQEKVNKKPAKPEKPAKPFKQPKPAADKKQAPAQKAKDKEKNVSGNRLMLLITIVNRRKAEYYADLIQGMGANLSFVAMAEGTASPGMLDMLGLTDSLKAAIFSVVKESSQKEILRTLDDKFASIRDGKGIAFTVPFSSVIGASVFNFLSDNRMHFK